MTTGTKANHKLLPQLVDSPNFLPLLRLPAVVDSPDAHWRQLFVDYRFQAGEKNSEKITDGKTLLTVCVKLSLCEIAAKSHLVFTRLSPCSALTSCSARFPSCSATTSLAYPSSFCQAGTRTTAGDSWLCIFQRNKNALPVNTPSPNTHSTSNITALQRTRTIYFFSFSCTCSSSVILFAIVAHQLLSLFFKQKVTAQTKFVFKHTWKSCEDFKIPQDSHRRAAPFLAISIG